MRARGARHQREKEIRPILNRKDDRDKRGGSPDEIIAFLGKGTRFKGVVTYDGAVRIDGHKIGRAHV